MRVTSFVGIPGSTSEAVKRMQWVHLEDHAAGSAYRAYCPGDGFLVALVSHDEVAPGRKLWHISVSHHDIANEPDRCPNWDELKSAAYRLIKEDIPLVLIFPKRSAEYLDIHPTTLHLWETTDKDIGL